MPMNIKRIAIVISAAIVLGLSPFPQPDPRASASEVNPWTGRGLLNIAHQGGEIEAPSNTLFALKTAKKKGADVLEIDVHATADRKLVVIHDATVDRTTNGTGRIDEMTLADIKKLDAAHWFVPGCGTCHDEHEASYSFRGFATREHVIPRKFAAYRPGDFKIPTLEQVLKLFPHTLINIEIKATAPETEAYEQDLAELLDRYDRGSDTIVVSFLDHAVEAFKLHSSEVSTATGTAETAAFWASSQGPLPGAPNPRYHALQVPIELEGVTVVTEDFVADAHANDLAVHVWTINDRDTMEWLLDIGVDGIMTDRPTLLEKVLQARRNQTR